MEPQVFSSSRSLDTMGAAAWIDLEARSPVPAPWSWATVRSIKVAPGQHGVVSRMGPDNMGWKVKKIWN